MKLIVYIPALIGILALVYTALRASWINRQDAGDAGMQNIAHNIARGASAFLKAEYKNVSVFVVIASALLYYIGRNSPNSHPLIIASFVIGAVCSALAGFIGMKIATKANVRTTQAARTSLARAFAISF